MISRDINEQMRTKHPPYRPEDEVNIQWIRDWRSWRYRNYDNHRYLIWYYRGHVWTLGATSANPAYREWHARLAVYLAEEIQWVVHLPEPGGIAYWSLEPKHHPLTEQEIILPCDYLDEKFNPFTFMVMIQL